MSEPGTSHLLSSTTETQAFVYRMLLLVLLLAWGVALFTRSYWTPDEPREAALSASMISGPHALPALAGVTFAEKPPLSYWLSGSSMRLLGNTPATARLPLLLYALLGVLAIARLGRTAGGRATGYAAAAIFATSLMAFQVQIWLECDALLLCGVSLALCGGYQGLAAATRRQRCLWYLLMHLGLTLAFFAKNFAGWLVPVTAIGLFILWEWRWREFFRWELWMGALLLIATIGGWTWSVAHGPDGAALLRILFWDNLVGRAVSVDAPTQYAYALAHRNSPGKYLLEMFIDLAPWSALLLCALGRVGRTMMKRSRLPSGWRFALCASVPALLILSFAATARSIYAAPCVPGLALLCALWVSSEGTAPAALRALNVSRVLIALLALALAAVSITLVILKVSISPALCALSIAISLGIFFSLARPPRQSLPTLRLGGQALAFALLLALGTLAPLRVFDRSQDLAQVAREVTSASHAAPLMLWHPDETTLAWSQLYLPPVQWRALRNEEADTATELDNALAVNPGIEVLVQQRTPAWHAREWLNYLRDGSLPQPAADAIPIEPALQAEHLQPVSVIERAGGRRYLLLRLAAN